MPCASILVARSRCRAASTMRSSRRLALFVLGLLLAPLAAAQADWLTYQKARQHEAAPKWYLDRQHHAQLASSITTTGAGWTGTVAPSGYTGPGDLITSNWAFWWGTYCFKSGAPTARAVEVYSPAGT